MTDATTRERQYQVCVDHAREHGLEPLGLRASESWFQDPKHLLFRLARYKFAAKMLAGRQHVLEIGCGDAFGTRIVQAETGKLTAIDFDPVFIEDVQARMVPEWHFHVFTHDLLEKPVPGDFDGVYALDVLEHIDPAHERTFLENGIANLRPEGSLIVGIPSLESQEHASRQSKEGHVNCKSAPDLKALLAEYFHNVFMFSMNDEVVHTGFHKMAHYVFAVAAGKRTSP